jgi:tetratricopeptide (TPR) repeat protein
MDLAVNEIAALEEAKEQEPGNADLHFRLGEVYWRMSRFSDALQAYQRAVQLDPRYLQHPSIQNRLIVGDDASLALKDSLITPKPTGAIQVRNVQTKHVERSDFWGVHPDENVYVVSGEAVNVGNKTCVNVQVEVTIYDFYEKVMDTRTVDIGAMKPGERRHFVAELNRFAGDPLDIRRHETQVFYKEQ